jgi:outer membrane protein assembly factor BamA
MVNIYFEVDNSFENDKPDDESFILFDDSNEQLAEKLGKVNCFIQLTPHTLQSYQTELVATNSSSDVGLEANLNFQHKNLFKGAEVFDTKLRGMLEFIKQSKETNYRTSTEFGGSVGISFPRFLSPFAGKELTTKFSPRTQLTASYSYSDRPDYTRTVAGMNFAYNWKDAKFFTYTISPVEVSMVNIFAIDPVFYSRIANTYQANSFVPQLITSSSYSVIFSNQTPKKLDSYAAIRFNVESSGNILRGLYYYTNSNSTDNTFQLLGIDFSQFVRSEINAVYNQIIDPSNSFAYRFYSGAAYPYGNSKAIPFEKKFFSGGSSGVRGWHARSLGPGTYSDVLSTYPNQSADIKIEANIEYRFKIVEMFEGALFADAGNIWAISSADERPGALFQLDKFYKQFALSTGLGIRLNLGFFVFRFDTGIKVFDPSIKILVSDDPALPPTKTSSQWIPFDRKYSGNDFVYHLGIGYPF